MDTEPAKHCCSYCGEIVPVRLLDRDGYAPDELICEECFSHDEAYWDCLPLPKQAILKMDDPCDDWSKNIGGLNAKQKDKCCGARP